MFPEENGLNRQEIPFDRACGAFFSAPLPRRRLGGKGFLKVFPPAGRRMGPQNLGKMPITLNPFIFLGNSRRGEENGNKKKRIKTTRFQWHILCFSYRA